MTESQNHTLNESISALIDGENNELDLRRVLKKNADDEQVRETWRRYQMAGAVLRGEKNVLPAIDLSAGVMAALEDEPAHKISTNSRIRTWLEGASKAGIAAAVAVGVLVGVQQFPDQEGAQDMVAQESAVSPAEVNASVPDWFQNQPLSARTVSGVGETHTAPVSYSSYPGSSALPSPNVSRLASDPELEAYLNRMLERHAQNAAAENGLKMVPLARASSANQE